MNSIVLIVGSKAIAELHESIAWYEAEVSGLGGRFLGAVDEVFEDILKMPQRFPFVQENARKALVPGFPYMVLFQEEQDVQQIRILAVFHHSRDPREWKSRL